MISSERLSSASRSLLALVIVTLTYPVAAQSILIATSRDFDLTMEEDGIDSAGFSIPKFEVDGVTPFRWPDYIEPRRSTMNVSGEAELVNGVIYFAPTNPVNTPLLSVRFDWKVEKFDPPILFTGTYPLDPRIWQYDYAYR